MAVDVEQQLAHEARLRPRAAAAALAAALLTLGAGVALMLVVADAPRSWFGDTLRLALDEGPIGEARSARVPAYEFIDRKAAELIGVAVMEGLGFLALGWVMSFLGKATRARRAEMPAIAVRVPVIGAVLYAVGIVLVNVGNVVTTRDFLDGPQTVDAAQDISTGSLLITGQLLRLAGAMVVAVGIVLVSLNAMRAGLLTRFLGVLGIIVGVLLIFPLGSPLPIVQAFWLVALGLLLWGRSRAAQPPAWSTGRAEPWPSAAEMREARRAEMEERSQGRGASTGSERAAPKSAEREAEAESPAASPAAVKRKRKRRR